MLFLCVTPTLTLSTIPRMANPHFLKILLLVGAVPSILSAGLATAYQDDKNYYIENDALVIALDKWRGSLASITHKQSKVNLMSRAANAYSGLWGFGMKIDGKSVFIDNGNTTSVNATITTTSTGASLTLVWKGLQIAAPLPNTTVTATISVRSDSQFSYWTIGASGLGANLVESINFPTIQGVGPLGQTGQDDVLLTSERKGTLYHNPTSTVPRGKYPGGLYPSADGVMQLMAYFDGAAGFYFAADDTQGYTKDFWWGRSDSPAGDSQINITYYPPGIPADSLSRPYNILVGATQGDWYAPADIYRDWTRQQQWTQRSVDRKVPTWLHDLPVIRNTCAHDCGYQEQTYAEALHVWERSRQALGVAALPELWGWEQFGQFAYGDYFPPKEGWASFDALATALLPLPLHVLPSGLYLDTSTRMFTTGQMASSAMLDEAGAIRVTPGATSGHFWAAMDFSTNPWRDYIVEMFKTLAQHGVGLLQLDSSMALGPQDCYNPSHTHPKGKGGNWQTLAWIDMAERVADAVATVNPDAVIAAEQPGEIYLPYFQVHHSSAEDQFDEHPGMTPDIERVPLFQYAFHDLMLFTDWIGPPYLDGSYFFLALARDFTWGQIPDWILSVGYTPEPDLIANAYMKRVISARTTYAQKFVVDGTMVPAPQLNVPTTPVTRIANYATDERVTRQYSSIHHSAWRASDGSIGIVLTNIAPNALTFSLPIEYTRLKLPSGAAFVVETTDGSSTKTLDANLEKDSTYSITVPSRDVLLVRLTPKVQRPQVNAGAVVLHASPSTTVAPGALFNVYGSNLAPATVTAPATPKNWPTLLGGVQVFVDDVPAPLYYVGPSQIVAQIPSSVSLGAASVVVSNAGALSDPIRLTVKQAAPSILTYSGNRAIAQNQDYSLNAATSPAAVGSYVTLYLVGSGPVTPELIDGSPAGSSPASTQVLPTTVTVGGRPATVSFSGLAPGFVGLVQVNFQVPAISPGEHPLRVTIGASESNSAVMAVGP